MATEVDIVNRSLQLIGTRTTVTQAQLDALSTNEAKQAMLVLRNIRDDLLRMAPWNCSLRTANLQYITSAPGTPENTSAPTTLWQPGQPAPPWAYEYQYPVDCLRACWIIPATQTGFAGGIPITTAVTGGAASFWQGPPVKFKVQTDRFNAVTAATVVAGGTGYAVGDRITLAIGPSTEAPIGGPAILQVVTAPGGVVATVSVVSQVVDASPALGGSYFSVLGETQEQDTTTGSGTGATFNLTQQSTQSPQRVILTNQEFATLVYCQRIDDVNVMDTQFQSAWSAVLGATMAMALSGDKALANRLIEAANRTIAEARTSDGNEGLTVNDVTPDFIRIRGLNYAGEGYGSAYTPYDWGSLYPIFG